MCQSWKGWFYAFCFFVQDLFDVSVIGRMFLFFFLGWFSCFFMCQAWEGCFFFVVQDVFDVSVLGRMFLFFVLLCVSPGKDVLMLFSLMFRIFIDVPVLGRILVYVFFPCFCMCQSWEGWVLEGENADNPWLRLLIEII